MSTPRKVVIAVDDSKISKDAVKWASEKLLSPNDEVHIVSVLEAPTAEHLGVAGESSYPVDSKPCAADPIQLENRCSTLKQYRSLVSQSIGKDEKAIKTSALVSCVGGSTDIARHICEYAGEQKADFLVVGSRGMGSAQRALSQLFGLGSVSQFLIQHAPVPNVLVHRGQPHL